MNVLPEPDLSSIHPGLLVFSDLDGTLLDDAYSWEAAKPALGRLASLGFPLVLSSSKTLDEMTGIAADLGSNAPLIAENGAVVAVPPEANVSAAPFGTEQVGLYGIEFNGLTRKEIVDYAHGLRQREGYQFEGFADWSVEQVMEHTGLNVAQATHSMARLATEPILWHDTNALWERFESELKAEGVRTIKGGRFVHLMGNIDKAMGLKRVVELYQELNPDMEWHVVALGDSPNDLEMLSAAHTAVVIPNPRHSAGLSPTAPRIIHASEPGPTGWNQALLQLLEPYRHHV